MKIEIIKRQELVNDVLSEIEYEVHIEWRNRPWSVVAIKLTESELKELSKKLNELQK